MVLGSEICNFRFLNGFFEIVFFFFLVTRFPVEAVSLLVFVWFISPHLKLIDLWFRLCVCTLVSNSDNSLCRNVAHQHKRARRKA